MGINYRSYAVIGFEIDSDMLYTTKEVRNCSCDIMFYEDTPPKFCYGCGKAFLTEKRTPIDGWDEDNDINGMTIVFGTDRKEAYIGAVIAKRSDYSSDGSFKKIEDDIKTMKEKIKKALGKELFEAIVFEKTFGLHSVLYCSY